MKEFVICKNVEIVRQNAFFTLRNNVSKMSSGFKKRVLVTSAVDKYTKYEVNKFRHPENVLNTSRTGREHATRVQPTICTV